MITSLKKLSKILNLPILKDENLFTNFPLLAPESFVKRIKPGDSKDPLLLQILPQNKELQKKSGYSKNPIFEKENSPIEGLIHKYPDRVLLLVTDTCAINCRFCFRRYKNNISSVILGQAKRRSEDLQKPNWEKIYSYIENHKSITEVILSGGDPLMLKPSELKRITDQLAKISHVKRIRIHSRVPIVMPSFIKANTIQSKLPVVLVVHCNHPDEISKDVIKRLNLLQKQNIIIFNQSVLLRGVNDDSKILASLSEKLFDAGVVPYYLHMLDKVEGAAHFCVDMRKAKKIYRELQEKLSGYLVPKLVVEVKGRKLRI